MPVAKKIVSLHDTEITPLLPRKFQLELVKGHEGSEKELSSSYTEHREDAQDGQRQGGGKKSG